MGAFLALVSLGVLADRIGDLKVIRFRMLLTVLSGFAISFSNLQNGQKASKALESLAFGYTPD